MENENSVNMSRMPQTGLLLASGVCEVVLSPRQLLLEMCKLIDHSVQGEG